MNSLRVSNNHVVVKGNKVTITAIGKEYTYNGWHENDCFILRSIIFGYPL